MDGHFGEAALDQFEVLMRTVCVRAFPALSGPVLKIVVGVGADLDLVHAHFAEEDAVGFAGSVAHRGIFHGFIGAGSLGDRR